MLYSVFCYWYSSFSFLFCLVWFLPGYKIDDIQNNVEEQKFTYDEFSDNYFDTFDPNQSCTDPEEFFNGTCDCRIGNQFNADKTCFVRFTISQDVEPPVLIHYELENFHQNHRSYYKSKDPYQLLGRVGAQDQISADDCQPLNKLRDENGTEITINPCGLIANTLFNDIFELTESTDPAGNPLGIEMLETGIAWQSDIDFVYEQPEGFEYLPCVDASGAPTCDCLCCDNVFNTEVDEGFCTNTTTTAFECSDWRFWQHPKTEECFQFRYPEEDTTQYLYETYPGVISPIEGVSNEHFMVWMRIATQPTFQKLYGWIDSPLQAGTTLTFKIQNNFVVTRFRGSKTLIVGSTSIFGGKNPYMAPVFIYSGFFCLAAGLFFALKHGLRPRKIGDPAYLHYKED